METRSTCLPTTAYSTGPPTSTILNLTGLFLLPTGSLRAILAAFSMSNAMVAMRSVWVSSDRPAVWSDMAKKSLCRKGYMRLVHIFLEIYIVRLETMNIELFYTTQKNG